MLVGRDTFLKLIVLQWLSQELSIQYTVREKILFK